MSAAVTVTITVDATPDPPVAVTPDYVIDEGDAVPLDASGSSDPDLAYAGPTITEQLFYSWDLNNDGTFRSNRRNQPARSAFLIQKSPGWD